MMQTTFANGVNPWQPYIGIKLPHDAPRGLVMRERIAAVKRHCADLNCFTAVEVSNALGIAQKRVIIYFGALGYRKTSNKIAHAYIWRKA
jgi:hypothetical protein